MVSKDGEHIKLPLRPTLFIDTEFNGFGGELISMALVGWAPIYDGVSGITTMSTFQFYQAVPPLGETDEWVEKNVIPVLDTPFVDEKTFIDALHSFLCKFQNGFKVVANWPADLQHFLSLLHSGPQKLSVPDFSLELVSWISEESSSVRHNALQDAYALMNDYRAKTGDIESW